MPDDEKKPFHQQINDGELPEDYFADASPGVALETAVGENNGHVVLFFNQPVKWMAMTPENALGLAQMLTETAQRLKQ